MTNNQHNVTIQLTRELPPGQLWAPIEGAEVNRLLAGTSLNEGERGSLLSESLSILGRCTDPTSDGPSRRAGLVVGGVQSGKTLSFTTVMGLARDNGFQLVILIAGTKDNLLAQSRDRLGDDLELARGDAHYRWVHYKSPKDTDVSAIAANLRASLSSGDDAFDEPPTVLITVMKNATHMANTAAALSQLGRIVDMNLVSALVIDDEADQATPNLKRSGESTTYRNLREIRDQLPRHTLLEYTATPQAPLLVSLADEISPDFTWVLTPGGEYTGGKYFFDEHASTFVQIIPQSDITYLASPGNEPPVSLLRALATFFVGATAERLLPGRPPSQRSMMVHPSQATLPHATFNTWVTSVKRHWAETLRAGGIDADELCDDYLLPAYRGINKTVPLMPSWDELAKKLPTLIEGTRIEEVNSSAGRSPSIDWSQAYSWILIGGALMDRGFTVEGLTVTYMPRSVGVGNADTLQQRGRFFGYKRSYAGFCRAWLENDVSDAFKNYVVHEQSMQEQLQELSASGGNLKQWRRRFLLDSSLRPTRQATIRLPLARASFKSGWLHQWHVPVPATSLDAAEENQRLVAKFLSGLDLQWAPTVSGTTPATQHDRAELSLDEVYKQLLVEFATVGGDQGPMLALLLSLDQYLSRNADPGCVIYNMSQGRPRERTMAEDSRQIKSLMQGRSRGEGYDGDRAVRDDHAVTLQVHNITVLAEDGSVARSNVPFLAISIPAEVELPTALVQR